MSRLDRWAPHMAPLKFQLVFVAVSYVWPIFQELWSTLGTASRRNAVLKDVSELKTRWTQRSWKERAEDSARREPGQPGPLVTPTDFKRICMLRQKTKYSPLWIQDGPGLLPWRNLGQSLSKPVLRPKTLALCWGQGHRCRGRQCQLWAR